MEFGLSAQWTLSFFVWRKKVYTNIHYHKLSFAQWKFAFYELFFIESRHFIWPKNLVGQTWLMFRFLSKALWDDKNLQDKINFVGWCFGAKVNISAYCVTIWSPNNKFIGFLNFIAAGQKSTMNCQKPHVNFFCSTSLLTLHNELFRQAKPLSLRDYGLCAFFFSFSFLFLFFPCAAILEKKKIY